MPRRGSGRFSLGQPAVPLPGDRLLRRQARRGGRVIAMNRAAIGQSEQPRRPIIVLAQALTALCLHLIVQE